MLSYSFKTYEVRKETIDAFLIKIELDDEKNNDRAAYKRKYRQITHRQESKEKRFLALNQKFLRHFS
ncbi:CLUMA_CG017217, isoform A [Clunio marinus]|uniref:CLUMA_CG017217, isoform A n=1 Tax=Clunio marinus TaxID=568069 RepID=A0A1J1IVH7_9DIPT|nr:CLUMA_CG017217, isoform A [Clunio marinus]